MVAAGSGSRLGAPVPKALVELGGVSLVRRSVDALVAGGVTEVAVTVPAGLEERFATEFTGVEVPVRLVAGGADRSDSVRRGLDALLAPDDAVVLVHDAARALVPPRVVAEVAEAVACLGGAVIPVLPVIDSVREVVDGGSRVVDRARLRGIQTPQGALLGQLRAAHTLVEAEGVAVTDDATVCEHAGLTVGFVNGDRRSLKITEPIDLVVAEALLNSERVL